MPPLWYVSATWNPNRGKEQASLFDSSWSRSPMPVVIGKGNLIEGLDRALMGAKEGSRLLIVIPPDLAYANHNQKGIPAKSTLVYTVDVLAVN
ncbi:FKBP-type peptidyl-prolyl cis-trans isomerase [Streptomyces sp. NPDC006173]|uniref:FKBP-type peptidyl-prolyl cis-trans isomerase n=1 Tax=Streptomyces sp. NPDC006173 TaxID=3155349 RepID=UPI00340FE804